MLFVAVDTEDGTLQMVWLIPSVDFANRTKPNSQNRHRFSASMKAATKDQWSEYRLRRADLAHELLGILDRL